MLERTDPLRGLLGIVLAVAFAALTGWIMVIGKSLLLPIIVAVISVYVLIAASEALSRLPGGRKLPEWARRSIVLLLFLVAVLALGGVMIATAEQIRDRLPDYQRNATALATELLDRFGSARPDWTKLRSTLAEHLSFQQLAGMALSSISSAAGMVFMVVIYAMFLMAERDGFAHKVAVALPGERGVKAEAIVRKINTAISDYLAVKTLINVILGAISYAVLWAFGVDFALFWAIIIALLNYIPYVGSLLGVAFPVLLSIAQFGSLSATLGLAALLTVAQMWVGNVLEPRMIGEKVNMSPFVVLVALGVWSAMWGIAGAILAIPLTSIIATIMASFESTRPMAVILAQDVDVFAKAEINTAER